MSKVRLKEETDITIYGTKEQADLIFNRARYLGFFAGRRYGKTFSFRNHCIYKCLSNSNFFYIYITPSYAQNKDEFIVLRDCLEKYIERCEMQPYPKIKFKNGSQLAFRSFDRPNLIRSKFADWVWVDEIQEKCFVEDTFKSVIRFLTADRHGGITVSGQFRGKDNWYYKEFFEKGQTDNPLYDSNHWSIALPSSKGLMFTDAKGRQELKDIENSTPKHIFAQECLCIPTEPINAVFQKDDLDGCIVKEIVYRGSKLPVCPIRQARSGYSYVLGLDVGKTKDNSAMVVLEQETGIIVHSELIPTGTKYEMQAQMVKTLASRYNAGVVIDSSGKAAGGSQYSNDAHVKFFRQFIPDLREECFTPSNKGVIVNTACLALQQKKVIIPSELEGLIEQLRIYEYTYASGYYKYNAPAGKHDDYVSAFILALWGRHNNWFKPTTNFNGMI